MPQSGLESCHPWGQRVDRPSEAVAMVGEAMAAGERAVVARVEARMAAAMAAVATAVGGG